MPIRSAFAGAVLLCVLPQMAAAFEATSPAFGDGGPIPRAHACGSMGGRDLSVPLDIRGVPDGTDSLAVVIDDPGARPVAGRTWVHWVLVDVPPGTTRLEAAAHGRVGLGVNGRNGAGRIGYQGMCPPSGRHTYVIAVYALRGTIGKELAGPTRDQFERLYGDMILGKAELRGDFGR